MSTRSDPLKGKKIPPITAVFDGKKHTLNVMQDLVVTDDLDSEFDRQPSLFAWYAVLAEEAAEAAAKTKQRMKNREEDLRVELLNAGEKLSVANADATIGQDKKVRVLRRKLIQAESHAKRLSMFVKAFDQRAQMLVMKGSRRRGEREISIRELEDKARKRTRKRNKER